MIILFGHQDMAKGIFIRFLLRHTSCDRVEILGNSIPGIHLSNKKVANIYLYPFSSFSVQTFCERTDKRTLAKKFCFCFLIKNIYTYFSYFTALWLKLVYPFFPVEMVIIIKIIKVLKIINIIKIKNIIKKIQIIDIIVIIKIMKIIKIIEIIQLKKL